MLFHCRIVFAALLDQCGLFSGWDLCWDNFGLWVEVVVGEGEREEKVGCGECWQGLGRDEHCPMAMILFWLRVGLVQTYHSTGWLGKGVGNGGMDSDVGGEIEVDLDR